MTKEFEALILGPKAGNADVMREFLLWVFNDHVFWRRNFHPEDPYGVTVEDRQSKEYKEAMTKLRKELESLLDKLRTHSVPFHSPRYLGHMTGEMLMPGALAYFATMLYNPNNVAFEASPVTTALEIEVGEQLAEMLGFKKEETWGHITCGGTIANYEGLWVARNLKYLPFCIREIAGKRDLKIDVKLANGTRKDIKSLEDQEILRSITPDEALNLKKRLLDNFKKEEDKKEVEEELTTLLRKSKNYLGEVIMPCTSHYSWRKAVEILNIGEDHLHTVEVDEKYRMDVKKLEDKIREIVKDKNKAILAVIAVMGTTEEGAVDPLHEIIELRNKFKEENIAFYIHVDAAYGGYVRSLFRDKGGREFNDVKEMQKELRNNGIIAKGWPDEDLFNAFRAIKDTESVTVDPHKLGYIVYPAGAVVFRRKDMRDVISCYAPYIFKEATYKKNPQLIGMYIFEGSKPGASAAACWLTHKVFPLNINGYGTFIGETIEGALNLYDKIEKDLKDFEISHTYVDVNGRKKEKSIKLRAKCLTKPDLNILCYAFNVAGWDEEKKKWEWNTSLKIMNKLNETLKERKLKFEKNKPILAKDFIVSSTDLEYDIYKDAPKSFLKELGINSDEWGKGKKVTVLRSTIMTPYLTLDYIEEDFVKRFIEAIKEKFAELLREGFFEYELGIKTKEVRCV